MSTTNFKKIIAALFVSAAAFLSVFIVSCQKELSGNGFTVTETLPDLTSRINSSVSGFVTDENNAAVEGASVVVGGINTTTDKYGYFEVSNASVVKNAALVTVAKSGYFKGIKTYIAAENKSAFFRIKLLPKTIAGNFIAASGGTVNLANGLNITFPADAVVLAATPATAYTGQVNVAAQWINPTAADLNKIMPGDLRGLDSDGFMKLLTTYGMAAVELTGASGELLQIAAGKKATMTFPIPNSILSAAPANLPLWSFDESNGLWKQEGQATKTGNNYVGEVSHFSFWNCDVPSNFVQFNCTLQTQDGAALPGLFVKVSVVGNTQQAGYGYTDSTGYTGGAVPNNSQLLLQVFTSGCGTPIFSQNFTTGSTNVSLGTLIIPSTTGASVSGSVNCSGAPVTDGFVIMQKDGEYYRFPLSNTGTFSFNTVLCSNSTAATFIGENQTTQESGDPVNYTLVPGTNAIGAISGCGTSIDQFINYTINGATYSLTYPTDSLISRSNNQGNPTSIFVSGNLQNSSPIGNTIYFSFTDNGIAPGSTQTLMDLYTSQIGDSTGSLSVPPSNVSITEYGAIGQFMAGNFTTTLTGAPPANTPYNITVNFRVRRN